MHLTAIQTITNFLTQSMKKQEKTIVAFDSKDFEILDSERELLAIRGGKAGWLAAILELLSNKDININGSCSHNTNCTNSHC